MRFVTFEQDGSCRPGLSVGRDRILDLPRSFVLARQAGLLDASLAPPETLLDLVAAGAEAMAACLNTAPERLAAMGTAARDRVLARHSIETEAARLLAHIAAD